MNKKALVLGANAGQTDLIRYLKQSNWFVCACANKASDEALELLDKFYEVNATDVNEVVKIANEQSVDIIYSVSSDAVIPALTKASERLGLPHFYSTEQVKLFTEKARLRTSLAKHSLSPVDFKVVTKPEDAAIWKKYPCIVKPSHSQGQRGLTLVEAESDIEEAVRKALHNTKDGYAIIEELLEGPEISINVLVQNGDVILDEISERLVHDPPLTGIPRGHLIPVINKNIKNLSSAKKLVKDIIEAFRIENGVLYFQIKMTDRGPRIVEIAPRLDGCHIWRMIKFARNFDLLENTIQVLLGKPADKPNNQLFDKENFELMFYQIKPGEIFHETDFSQPSDVLYKEFRYKDGQKVDPINGKLEVVGYYVRRYE